MKYLNVCNCIVIIMVSSLLSSCIDDEPRMQESQAINIYPPEEFSNQLYIWFNEGTGKEKQPTFNTNDLEKDTLTFVSSWDNLSMFVSTIWNGAFFFVDATSNAPKLEDFMEDKAKHFETVGYDGSFDYIYAGIQEGAAITADKTLFGQEAGSNLGSYFDVVIQDNQVFSATYPDFYVIHDYRSGERIVSFTEFFSKDIALSYAPYHLCLKTVPEERYSEIVLTVSIPIECDYMQQLINGSDYDEKYYEQGYIERNENRVLKGSVTVRFKE